MAKSEKGDAAATVFTPIEEQPSHDLKSKIKIAWSRARRAWLFPVLHIVFCLILSLVLALVINGYQAINTTTPRYYNGVYVLRVSDVTTLVSLGLVFIKITVTSWTILTLWRCADILKTKPGLALPRFAFMMRWKAPPWIMWPPKIPEGQKSWVVAVVLLLILPQPFIAPLLSGAVDWNTSSIPGQEKTVSSGAPNPNPGAWYYYLNQDVDRSAQFRRAGGAVSLTWDTGNGAIHTGNGCRHIVNNDGLPVNSTLKDALIPCLVVHDIKWDTTAGSSDVNTVLGNSKEYSIVLEGTAVQPFDVYQPGITMVFDFGKTRGDSKGNYTYSGTDNHTASHLPPLLFTGTKSIILMLSHQSSTGCSPIDPSTFGDMSQVKNPYSHTTSNTQELCYATGKINFTAGVIKSSLSTYITSRVVESQDAVEDLAWQSDVYTQEALWMLPDLMAMAAIMNSSSIPTFDNLDNYAATLLRYSYLAAWDTLTSIYGLGGAGSVDLVATTREPRIQATVSYARVFAWLGINLLTTVSAILLWWIRARTGTDHTDEVEDAAIEEVEDAPLEEVDDAIIEEVKGLNDLVGINYLIDLF
ncbi:hypothetical protein B0O99DRAFT_527129 [Bisporella sp. PMI_857]|nr:hypothetical protein B0O99DRAFT_527129 [Bisporella sp. PMI_857]